MRPDRPDRLLDVLRSSRELGFLGPGPVEDHVSHSLYFLELIPENTTRALDLGSGGGVPGLVLAQALPHVEWYLLDASSRRTAFLRDAADALALANLSVLHGRAEELAHDLSNRGTFDVVTARSFAIPAVTAECGAGFLRAHGRLIVSEPPSAENRWPNSGLSGLGLSRVEEKSPSVCVLELTQEFPERYPRRVGIPSKRPLF